MLCAEGIIPILQMRKQDQRLRDWRKSPPWQSQQRSHTVSFFVAELADYGSEPNPATCSYKDLLEQPAPVHVMLSVAIWRLQKKADRIE